MKFSVNRKDIKFSLKISSVVSFFIAAVCIFIKDDCNKNENIKIAYNTTMETLSVFSLTFLGFIITAFTILQILQSKSWFDRITETDAFCKLLNSFELLIILSACGIFISLLLRISVSILNNKYIFIAGILFSTFLIAFICSFAWKTMSGIFELIRA